MPDYTPTELAEERLLRYRVYDEASQPYLQWQLSALQTSFGRRILEVGCGIGSITNLLGERELILSLDVDEEVLAYAQERLASRSHCRFELLDITNSDEEQLAELRELRFDTVLCVNVLEHIENDERAVQAFWDVLAPGGKLLLLVPAHPTLYGPYDAHDGHYRRYAKSGLKRLLIAKGFEILALRYFNAAGAVGWFLQYRIMRREAHEARHFRLMNRLIPMLSRAERIVPPPFGLSLVAVCRKPDSQPSADQPASPAGREQ